MKVNIAAFLLTVALLLAGVLVTATMQAISDWLGISGFWLGIALPGFIALFLVTRGLVCAFVVHRASKRQEAGNTGG